jgi:outer membrane protein TolC
MLRSAEDRIKASKEVLRVIELRYKNGLARMVDILDAQTELDKARLERIQAINACHKAYADLLFGAGLTEEVKR